MVACYQRHSIWMVNAASNGGKSAAMITALPDTDSFGYLRRWPSPMRLARSERAAA